MYVHWVVHACLMGLGTNWTLGCSYEVYKSDTLRLRLVCKIEIQEGPSLGIMLEYSLGTWVGKSLA